MSGGSEPKDEVSFRVARELLAGGISNAIASCLMNPMDVTKIRIQTQAQLGAQGAGVSGDKLYNGFSHAVKRIVAEEGIFARHGGLWLPGLCASMMREFGYSSFRFGMYPIIKGFFGADKGEDIGLARKMAAGLTTGGLGSALANPCDLVKIRLQREAGSVGADGMYTTGLHKGKHPTYSGTLNAFMTILRQEGLRGCYTGVSATIARAAFLACGQLASYDHTKTVMKERGLMTDGVPLHIFASLVSGFCATTACQPFDTVKTRFMTDRQNAKPLYRNPVDCLAKTLRHDGFFRGLFRGWVPSYLRIGPHFIIALPIWEQVRFVLGLGYLN